MIRSEHVPAADSLYVTVDGRRVHYLRVGDSRPPRERPALFNETLADFFAPTDPQ